MENKLEQLTQKLYNEGLEKGRSEADALTAAAKEQAASIVAAAEAKAADIVKKAQQKAEDTAKNSQTEIAMAARQAINTLKQQIEGIIVTKSVKAETSKIASDPAFIKDMLIAVAQNWNSQSGGKIELKAMLPEKQKAGLEKLVSSAVQKELQGSMEINFDAATASGFKVMPKDGGFYVSFSEESFEALIKEYLRPAASQMLFETAK